MRKTKMWLFLPVLLLFFTISPAQPVYAAGAIGSLDKFDSLQGEGKYLGSQYRDNYYLDLEETGLMDMGAQMLNDIANILFSFIRWLAYLTVSVFYICFNLNLADLFGSQVNAIQSTLNQSIFQPLFLLACGTAFCVLAGRMIKQDLAGTVGQLVKIVGVVMLSILTVTESATVLSACTGITKEVSVSVLSGVNGANGYAQNVNDFAARAAGILWQNLVHEPWLTIEFGTDNPTAEDVERFLTTSTEDEQRKELMENYPWGCFDKKRGGERLGFMAVYLVPFLGKCIVYLLVAIVQLVFQLLAIFYIFMAPLILILSLVPGYERMLGIWLRKILESQVSILIITMMIGILIKFDQLIYDWAKSNAYGWMIALVIQVSLAIALFLNRNKLLNLMTTVQRGVAAPAYAANKMRMSGNNTYQSTVPNIIKTGGKITRVMPAGAYRIATGVYNSVHKIVHK